jgi:hypothetical protein
VTLLDFLRRTFATDNPFGVEPKWGKGLMVDGVSSNAPQMPVDRRALAQRAQAKRAARKHGIGRPIEGKAS